MQLAVNKKVLGSNPSRAAMKYKKFNCELCGDIEYALHSGYGVGDLLLEGVMFQIRKSDKKYYIKIDPSFAEYFKKFNVKMWLALVLEDAKRQDFLTCPKCGNDVENI